MTDLRSNVEATSPDGAHKYCVSAVLLPIVISAISLPFLPTRTPVPIAGKNLIAIVVVTVSCSILLYWHFRQRQNTSEWNLVTRYILATLTIIAFLITMRLLLHGEADAMSQNNMILRFTSNCIALLLFGSISIGALLILRSGCARGSGLFWETLMLCIAMTWSLR